jgi:hypothetical protein
VGEDGGEAEVGLDAGAGLVAEGVALFDREGEDFEGGGGEGLGVARGDEGAGVAHDPGGVADVGGDDGDGAGHGFADDVREAFAEGGGGDGEVEGGGEGGDVGVVAVEVDVVLEVEVGDELGEFGVGGVDAGSGEVELGVGDFLGDEGGGLEEGGVVLHGGEATEAADAEFFTAEIGWPQRFF